MATKATKTAATEEKPKTEQNPPQSFDWGGETHSGFEGTRPEDLGIPFLSIIQSGSPEVKKTHPNYATKKIEGAEEGDVMNTLARKVVYGHGSDPLLFIPVFHEKLYVEWRLKSEGGGFVQSHKSPVILTKTKRNEDKQDILIENGNEIKTTSYFAGFYLDTDTGEYARAVIGMTSTQLKKARAWLNMAQAIKLGGRIPPLYSHQYKLTTVGESNNDGSWMGWKVEIDRVLNQDDAEIITGARQLVTTYLETKQIAAPSENEEVNEADKPY